MNYVQHEGKLKQGELIVIEVRGKLIPKRPWDLSPQVFMVEKDQEGTQSVALKPIKDAPKDATITRYVAGGFRS